MVFDPSIFAQANKPTTALLTPNEVMQDSAKTATAVYQNRLQQASQARGELMQQAIDPTTGQYDATKFNRLLAADPRAALMAPESVGQSQGLMTQQNTLASSQNAYLNQALGAVLALPDDKIHAGTVSAMQQGIQRGLIKPEDGMAQLLRLPGDAAGLRQQLTVAQQSLMTPEGQQANTYGAPSAQSDGQNLIAGTTAPARLGGGFSGASVTPVYPSRSELAGRTTVGVNPDGSIRTGPLANVTPQGLAGPAGQPSPLGSGRLPAALRNPNGPASAAPPAQPPASAPGMTAAPGAGGQPSPVPAPLPAANNGEVTTGLGPAQTAAQTATGAQSADAFKEIANQAVAAQGRGAVLDNMLSDTKQFTSGPGTDQILRLRQVAGRLGLPANTDATTAAESFNKLAAQLANQQGGGTDARLNVAQAGNPHGDLSPDGLDQMLRQLRGNEDYIGARAKLAAGHPNPADRTGFEANVGAQLDPRTFQYDRLTPAQKATYFKNLDDKPAFVRAHEAAAKLLGR